MKLNKKIGLTVKLLSVNEVWQGRRFKTKKYHAYEQELLMLLPKEPMIKGNVQINYWFFVKNMNRDVDNLIKPLQDIIVKKGYIEDDRKIITLTATKLKSEIERFEIDIWPL